MTPNAVVVYRSDSSSFQSGTDFGNRGRRRLDRARQNGYLDARCGNDQKVRESFGLWCWRLKIPMVWFERQTPRSKYGRVHLELFTTTNQLTGGGQEAIRAICATFTVRGQVKVSPFNADCDRILLGEAEDLAKAVFRTAVRSSEPATHGSELPAGNGSWQAASA